MRKTLTSLAAAAAAGTLIAGSGAAAAFAAPPNPDGSSTGVVITQSTHTADMTFTRGAADSRTPVEWTCGKLRLDGWASGTTATWRLNVGATYALPPGTAFNIGGEGTGWRLTGVDRPGSATTGPAPSDLAGEGIHPPYTYVADQATAVAVTYSPASADDAIDSYATITLPNGLPAGQYFNLELDATIAADTNSATNVVVTSTACDVPEPVVTPSPEPIHKDKHDKHKHPVKVNAGGENDATSGLLALAFGAAAVSGLAVYGLRRAKK